MNTARQEIKELEKKIAELQAGIPTKKVGKLTVKVGEKGNLVIYGLQRFPLSLYLNQVPKLMELFSSTELKEFMIQNKDKFAVKE